ncbi:pseudouridine synthase [Butyrivibrio sp. MC2013]|uniref:pseudouridine synthase n=1 Tax=Butyrivibrio sp. MC2013 TaxID=1280686 RepID=UPI0003FB4C8A|nr:pseudouridine synthase [Butyrivibrio sp. MC2013]
MQRLDKFLADRGLGTRKQIKDLIKNGTISVNGDVIYKADTHIDETTDHVYYMGEELVYEKNRYYILNKPSGVITATNDKRAATVLDLLEGENTKGLSPVGRLDIDTEGLLIITDDGALNHYLLSPSHHVEKEYEVHLRHDITDKDIEKLIKGVDIGDRRKDNSPDITLPAKCRRGEYGEGADPVIYLAICEGRFHQVKRMLEAVGNEVTALKRVRMGGLSLPADLEISEYRRLTADELTLLKKTDDLIVDNLEE